MTDDIQSHAYTFPLFYPHTFHIYGESKGK